MQTHRQSLFAEVDMVGKRSEPPAEPGPDHSDLVAVMYAANRAEAEFYQTLLADADIQVTIDTETKETASPGKGIAVLVPAELLDTASDIITVREEMEEHILAGPDDRDRADDDDEDHLTAPRGTDDMEDEEDLLFHRDPFVDEDERY